MRLARLIALLPLGLTGCPDAHVQLAGGCYRTGGGAPLFRLRAGVARFVDPRSLREARLSTGAGLTGRYVELRPGVVIMDDGTVQAIPSVPVERLALLPDGGIPLGLIAAGIIVVRRGAAC